MSLHDRIMKEVDAFPFNTMSMHLSRESLKNYIQGFDFAKKQSAIFAKEADELIADMAETISTMTRWIDEGGSNGQNEGINDICKMGEESFEKYKAWKDQTK